MTHLILELRRALVLWLLGTALQVQPKATTADVRLLVGIAAALRSELP